jgi:hypothetical protein
VVAISATTACSSSATRTLDNVCGELYGQGLTGCTEHCRPFGVLDFGVIVRADGSIAWTCECMPGPTLGEEGPTPEEGTPDGDPPNSLGSPVRHVEIAAIDRGPDAAAAGPPTDG